MLPLWSVNHTAYTVNWSRRTIVGVCCRWTPLILLMGLSSCLDAALFWYYVLHLFWRLRSSLSSTSHQPPLHGCHGHSFVFQMAPEGEVGEQNWQPDSSLLTVRVWACFSHLNIPNIVLGSTSCQQTLLTGKLLATSLSGCRFLAPGVLSWSDMAPRIQISLNSRFWL